MVTPKIEDIKHYIEMHQMLYGFGATPKDITKDLVNSFGGDETKVLKMVKKFINQDNEIEYGAFIGRCQPFHLGHQAVINEIMLDGKKPIIVLGSIDKLDDKNPLTFEERKSLIEMIYPNDEVIIIGMQDYENWDEWGDTLKSALTNKRRLKDITIYYHNKECDRCDFTYKGSEYLNMFYTEVFKYENIKTKEIEFVDRHDFKIDSNARDIRHDLEGYKHFIDARIYWELINKGWK